MKFVFSVDFVQDMGWEIDVEGEEFEDFADEEFDCCEDDGIEYDEDGVAWWFDDEEEVWYYFDEEFDDWFEYDDSEDEDSEEESEEV